MVLELVLMVLVLELVVLVLVFVLEMVLVLMVLVLELVVLVVLVMPHLVWVNLIHCASSSTVTCPLPSVSILVGVGRRRGVSGKIKKFPITNSEHC